MVKAEVDRILREQGLGGFVSQGKGGARYVGRSVAVIPDLDTPRSYDGLNRTLAMALGDAMGRTKDLRVSGPDQVKRPCARPGSRASSRWPPISRPWGITWGCRGSSSPASCRRKAAAGGHGPAGLRHLHRHQGRGHRGPAGAGRVNAEAVTKFAKDNALRVGGDLINMRWFGRVDLSKKARSTLTWARTPALRWATV